MHMVIKKSNYRKLNDKSEPVYGIPVIPDRQRYPIPFPVRVIAISPHNYKIALIFIGCMNNIFSHRALFYNKVSVY